MYSSICTRCISSSYKSVYTTAIWRQQFSLASTLFHHKVISHNKVTSFCDSKCYSNISSITNSNHNQQPKFGIVAALSKDGIIGMNGRLPWKSIPQDINHFINLTRNKILIVGRKTFAEDSTGNHIKHVRVCIVISKTMSTTDLAHRKGSTPDKVSDRPQIMIACSFEDALYIASTKILQSSDEESVNSSSNDIDLWVAGGERIYKEALQHDNAVDVHLTHIDVSVGQRVAKDAAIAYFPLDTLESSDFREVSRSTDGICSFCLYRRPPEST